MYNNNMEGNNIIRIVRVLSAIALMCVLAGCQLDTNSFVSSTNNTSVNFTNKLAEPIRQLNVSMRSWTSWGADQLRGAIILVDDSFQINRVPCGVYYDIRAVTLGNQCAYLVNKFISCVGESFVLESSQACPTEIDDNEFKMPLQ